MDINEALEERIDRLEQEVVEQQREIAQLCVDLDNIHYAIKQHIQSLGLHPIGG